MERVTKRAGRAAKLAGELTQLEQFTPAALRQAWQAQEGSEGPNVAASLLRRLLAQRIQERRLGALPGAVARELERMADGPIPAAPPAATPRVAAALTPGTRLIREWQGRTIAVLALEDGFLWEDRAYRSLSEIAREVTGARWSGPRFFGLTRRG